MEFSDITLTVDDIPKIAVCLSNYPYLNSISFENCNLSAASFYFFIEAVYLLIYIDK